MPVTPDTQSRPRDDDFVAERLAVMRRSLRGLPDPMLRALAAGLERHGTELVTGRLYRSRKGGGCAVGVMLRELDPQRFECGPLRFWLVERWRRRADSYSELRRRNPRLRHMEWTFDETARRLRQLEHGLSRRRAAATVGGWLLAATREELAWRSTVREYHAPGAAADPRTRPRDRAVAVTLLALLALAAAPAVADAAALRSSATVTFTSRAPASPSGVDWSIDYRDPADPNGKPPAVESTVAVFPDGSRIDTSAPEQCRASDSELTLMGVDACPAATRVATGKLDVDTGSLTVIPRIVMNDVSNFNNQGESVIFTESTNMPGTQTRTVSRGRIEGNTITTDVPAIPGAPPPDAYTALKSFRLSVPALTRGARTYVTTPPTCPATGHWTFRLSFLYRDGVSETIESPSPCVQDATTRPRLRLTVKPRRATAGRATRFRFRALGPGGLTVEGARVAFAGRRQLTDAAGRAVIVRRIGRRGRVPAKATARGLRSATVRVRVSTGRARSRH
jgi:hypothetical protein